jgi:cytidylate kinase
MDVLAYLLASAQVRAMRGRLGVSKNTLKSETRRLLLKCQARDATALLAKLSARGPEPAR